MCLHETSYFCQNRNDISSDKSVKIEYENGKKRVAKSTNRAKNYHFVNYAKRVVEKPKVDPALKALEQRAKLEYERRAYYEMQRAYHQKRVKSYYDRQRELALLESKREHRVPLEVGRDGMMTPQKRKALAYKRFQDERRRHILMAKRAKLRANKIQEIN